MDEEKYHDTIFYKERWINENGLEQRLIVTYSIKSRNYQRNIRNKQITRAKNLLNNNAGTEINHHRQTDYKRFITMKTCTEDGEIAEKKLYEHNQGVIDKEEKFDGFYGICTNVESSVQSIVNLNHRR